MSAHSPDAYVRDNQEMLVKMIKYDTDDVVRAFALAALVEYGEEPDIEHVRGEL